MTSLPGRYGTGYGVRLDGDPSGLDAAYHSHELADDEAPGGTR